MSRQKDRNWPAVEGGHSSDPETFGCGDEHGIRESRPVLHRLPQQLPGARQVRLSRRHDADSATGDRFEQCQGRPQAELPLEKQVHFPERQRPDHERLVDPPEPCQRGAMIQIRLICRGQDGARIEKDGHASAHLGARPLAGLTPRDRAPVEREAAVVAPPHGEERQVRRHVARVEPRLESGPDHRRLIRGRCQTQPEMGFDIVMRDAMAGGVFDPQIVLRQRIALWARNSWACAAKTSACSRANRAAACAVVGADMMLY